MQCNLNKFNHLKYRPRQTQQCSLRDKESTCKDQTTEKRQISYTAAVRKGNSIKNKLISEKEQHKYPNIFG